MGKCTLVSILTLHHWGICKGQREFTANYREITESTSLAQHGISHMIRTVGKQGGRE